MHFEKQFTRRLIMITFFLADATAFGPDIKTHAFPSPALRGLTLRLECIAYGTYV